MLGCVAKITLEGASGSLVVRKQLILLNVQMDSLYSSTLAFLPVHGCVNDPISLLAGHLNAVGT